MPETTRIARIEHCSNHAPMSTDWNVRVLLSDGSTLAGVVSVEKSAGSADELGRFRLTLLDLGVEWIGVAPLRALVQPRWVRIDDVGAWEWEIEVDVGAAPDAPAEARSRYRPRAYSGEPEPDWLPGSPPSA